MSVIENTSHVSSDSSSATVESLKMLLGYAIAEGDELHLPVFVLLLRMAKLELAKNARGESHLSVELRSASDAEERVVP